MPRQQNRKRIWIFLLFGLLISGGGLLFWLFSSSEPEVVNPDFKFRGAKFADCLATPDKNPDFLGGIGCEDDFKSLAGLPLTSKYGKVTSVKVVYSLATQSLYFQNSKRFASHYDFCSEVLNYKLGLSIFNETQYKSGRKYLLGSLDHHVAKNETTVHVLEIFPGDWMTLPEIKTLYEKVQNSFFAEDPIQFHPATPEMEEKALKMGIPVISTQELYQNQSYFFMNEGVAIGRLKFYGKEKVDWNADEIVLLDKLPLDPGPVAGVITTVFQTPLSHVNVLARNRKFPNMVLLQSDKVEDFRKMEGQICLLKVSPGDFELRLATEAEIQIMGNQPKIVPQLLEKDIKTPELISVSEMGAEDLPRIGGKAAWFGEIAKVQKSNPDLFEIPEGAFAIPFFWYQDHLDLNGIQFDLEKLFAQPDSVSAQDLKQIRDKIREAPVNKELIFLVESRILRGNAGKRMRFRSSTNAEDLPEFNGAGLYTSKTGVLGSKKKSIADAIRKVWASLWTEAAWQHRRAAGIDQRSVAMGILVHRSFPDELANGVAVTKNIYDKSNKGFVVNVQTGEVSVVSPPEGVTCDEIILYRSRMLLGARNSVDYRARSSLTSQPVMRPEELENLTQALEMLHQHFQSVFPDIPDTKFALDVEFKLDGANRRLYIKQARVY